MRTLLCETRWGATRDPYAGRRADSSANGPVNRLNAVPLGQRRRSREPCQHAVNVERCAVGVLRIGSYMRYIFRS